MSLVKVVTVLVLLALAVVFVLPRWSPESRAPVAPESGAAGPLSSADDTTEPAVGAATRDLEALVLTGILYNDSQAASIAVIASPGYSERAYRIGDQIAGTSNAVVDSIFRDRAVVDRDGEKEVLRLTYGADGEPLISTSYLAGGGSIQRLISPAETDSATGAGAGSDAAQPARISVLPEATISPATEPFEAAEGQAPSGSTERISAPVAGDAVESDQGGSAGNDPVSTRIGN